MKTIKFLTLILALSFGSYQAMAQKTISIDPANNQTKETLSSVSIYPVPFHNDFTVKFGNYDNQPIVVTLFDALGKFVLKKEISSASTKIDVDHLQNGVYILQIKIDDTLINKKVVKR